MVIDRGSHAPPLNRQIYERWRDGILAARFRGGDKVPSTRELADALSVSRATVTAAYDQLVAEGYFETTRGAGTFVCRELPDTPILGHQIASRRTPSRVSAGGARTIPVRLSRYGQRLQPDRRRAAVAPGVIDLSRLGPDVDRFPFEIWRRLLARHLRAMTSGPGRGRDHTAGYIPLREQIVAYLARSRAVRCDADQVIMAASTSTSEDLPLRWVWIGGGISAVLMIAVQWMFFRTPIWHSVLAIALSVPLALVALRVLGETNWGPISQMTNLTQAVFGIVAPGDLRASMVSSGITGAVAAESEGLMQDYKAGWMIGSTPRILTYMQLIAVPVGALALAVMYPLIRDTYGIIGEHAQLLSPTSQRWVGFAKVVTHELSGPVSSPHPVTNAILTSSSAVRRMSCIYVRILGVEPIIQPAL